jgi:hypothetical protein
MELFVSSVSYSSFNFVVSGPVFEIMYMQCNQSIVEDFKQILSILAFLVSVSLGILEYIAETESLTVAAIDDELRRLKFVLRVVLLVGAVDIIL